MKLDLQLPFERRQHYLVDKGPDQVEGLGSGMRVLEQACEIGNLGPIDFRQCRVHKGFVVRHCTELRLDRISFRLERLQAVVERPGVATIEDDVDQSRPLRVDLVQAQQKLVSMLACGNAMAVEFGHKGLRELLEQCGLHQPVPEARKDDFLKLIAVDGQPIIACGAVNSLRA